MEYRKLGRTDINVSVICLGTMTWGRQNTQQEGHEQIDYALEHGVNFLDTAEFYAVPPTAETYGKTETIIGNWFAEHKSRDKIILATKIVGPGPGWVRDNKGINKKNIQLAVEDSLKRLQTDYIDLYQLHWPNRGSYHFQQIWDYNPKFDAAREEEKFLETLETLDDLIKSGKIRAIGLSNESTWGTMKYLRLSEDKKLPRMASIQNEYSLNCRIFEGDLQEMSLAEDCGLLAWSPLATGMLSGKYIDGARPDKSRWTLDGWNPGRDTKPANDAVKAYSAVAQKHGLDPSQMALAFVNSRPFVTSNIIGATTMEQLKINIASIDVTLNDEVLKDIAQVYRNYPRPF